MGDHRATIKCSFEMHGHKAENEWWINQDTAWCDQRIIDWFNVQVEMAMAFYQSEMAEYRKEEAEATERKELERLKAKYESNADKR